MKLRFYATIHTGRRFVMKKKLYRYLLLMLLVFLANLFFVTRAHASINYSQANSSFSLSFDSANDLGDCSGDQFWLVNLGYDNGTQVQGPLLELDITTSTT